MAVSELPPHPETTNKNVSATAYFLIATFCHPSLEGGGEGVFDALTCSIRVAHFVAQNAHHHTDTGVPVRHTSLNPRALAVQADTLERFLCPGGLEVGS